MSYRHKAGRGDGRRFTHSAMRVHPKNVAGRPMRGGIRL